MSEPRWLDRREERVWRGYLRMRALLDLTIARDLNRDAGLSDADYTVLVALSESPGQRLRLMELAERLLWSKSRVSHQLTRMQRRGLVERGAHPDNHRAVDAILTGAGRAAIERAAPGHVESVRRHFLDQLTDAHVDALAEVTDQVIAHLRDVLGSDGIPGGATHSGRARPIGP